MHYYLLLFHFLFLLFSQAQSAVKDPIYDELDGYVLINTLIQDEKLDLAAEELKSQKPSTSYWMAYGKLHLAAHRWSEARDVLLKANSSRARALLLGRAFNKLSQFDLCAQNYAESQKLWLANESDIIAKAVCDYKLNHYQEAWTTLNDGYKQHTTTALLREQISFLLEMHLHHSALQLALNESTSRSTSDLLSIAEIFFNKQNYRGALLVTELARVRQPFDLDVNISSAQIYYHLGQIHSAAEAFERAATQQFRFANHAAELWKQAGHTLHADYLAQYIPGKSERLKFMLSSYVDGQNFPLVASMNSIMQRSSLVKDDEVQYALAFSFFQQNDFSRAKSYLASIRKPELQEKVALLRKSIESH